MDKKKNLNIFICIVGICLFSLYAGLSDYDYFWQVKLGEKIVREHNFMGINDLVWGSLNINTYYDHEWLSNVVFYLFSLIHPIYGVVLLKTVISLFVGICLYRLTKCFSNINKTSIILLLTTLTIYATIGLKVKAYSISTGFLIIELLILYKYSEEDKPCNLKRFIQMFVLTIVWNNMHSGSVLLLFVIAGLYWLISARNRYVFTTGLTCFIGLGINPYGYKLILFDVLHNFNKVMKQITLDWRPLDTKEELGQALFLVLVVYVIYLTNIKLKDDLFLVLSSIILLYMTLGSARHIVYFLPILWVIILKSDFTLPFIEKINLSYVSFFISGLALLVMFTTYSSKDLKQTFLMDYKDDELVQIIKDTTKDNSEGLYTSTTVDLFSDDIKVFMTGAYPHAEKRILDGLVLEHSSEDNIKQIIDYYNLDKFLILRTDTTYITYYNVETPLYNYLNTSDRYEKLYESKYYTYFIEKEN